MNNELLVFKNEQFGSIRTLQENGTVWFCATDVAVALGYKSPRSAIRRHCLGDGVVKRNGVSLTVNQYGTETEQSNLMTFINEGNLYRLIVHSKLPSAMQFEKWVFEEVLPSIRKYGVFAVDQLLDNPDLLIKALQRLKDEQEKSRRLMVELQEKDSLIEELQPKASYYDLILQSKSTLSTTQIAKDYGMSAIAFNKLLSDEGIQFKQSNQWVLYQKYSDEGYTQSKSFTIDKDKTVQHMYWTQKGRIFLYKYLKSNVDLVPAIEREEQE